MAYLDATQLNDIQEGNGSNEKRFSELGLIDAVKGATPGLSEYISPSAMNALRTISASRAVKIPVIKDQSVVVHTSPSFSGIPNNFPESAEYSFVQYDVFSGFRHIPSSYANNSIDADFARNQVMKNVLEACGTQIESILATQLETRKTQLLNYTTQASQGAGTYTFNAGTDTLEINKAAQKAGMFYNLQNLMADNDMSGDYHIATSRGGMNAPIEEAMQYGAGNDKNLQALGFLPSDRIHQSKNLSAGSDIFNGWLLRNGSIGMIENFPYDFVQGTEIAGKKWSISDMELPFAKMRANVFVNTEATEATSLISPATDSNLIMTTFEEMAVWFRFTIAYRYNSDLTTRTNDIIKLKGTVA